MSYNFNQRKKNNKSNRAAEEHSTLTPVVKKRLKEAEGIINSELAHIKELLKKPLIGKEGAK